MSSDGGFQLEIEDRFMGPNLDRELWIPHFLPQWSTREASAARYSVGPGGLSLLIEADQPAWSAEFDRTTRVSSLQTGVFSGPVGSAIGQHHFRDGLVVREAQEAAALFTPTYGRFECRARALANPANMVALWMIGFEDEPERSAEICIFEVFGRDVRPDGCLVGMGIHPFGDQALTDDFEKVPVAIDAREPHTYAAEWTRNGVRFLIDDKLVKESRQSPGYPMQFMISLFEFPDGPELPSARDAYPKKFEVEWFRAYRPVRSPSSTVAQSSEWSGVSTKPSSETFIA